MAETKIEWTDATWNPVRGCTKVSPGCAHCYAETFAERWRGIPGHPYEQGFDLRLVSEKLHEPLKWRKPRRVFVNSMSDLFHKGVPDEFIDQVFAVMALCPQHTFQVLTKRPERMQDYLQRVAGEGPTKCWGQFNDTIGWAFDALFPLPSVWLGVSVENQATADERVPLLLQTPAAVRFLSCEPLLSAVDLRQFIGGSDTADDDLAPTDAHCVRCGCLWEEDSTDHDCPPGFGPRPDWVIVGGESGQGARPMHPDWARSIRDQCQAAGVPFFMKQMTSKAEIPDDLFIREFPDASALTGA